tara:strand:- start:218 stop:550 length:333 start_codon:yes stop_codon:yes gene_type:complete
MKNILLILTVFVSFKAFAEENVFVCQFNKSQGAFNHTLIINTDEEYLRFNSAKYDKDYTDTDLYIEASIKDSKEFGNQRIHFNKITGEVRRELQDYNLWHQCKESSKLVP